MPASLRLAGLAIVATMLLASASFAEEPPMLARALDGPLKGIDEVVFCMRLPYEDPHWYANIGYFCDDETKKAYTGNGKPDVGKLFAWNFRTKALRTIVDDPGGSIRDPQIHYDGKKVLFSWRKHGTDSYNLYEVDLDGKNLRRITDSPYDDYEPTYLADGGICFVSTRCKRWVNCWMTQVGTMYRCDANGSNVECISANTEHDNTPWPLPDGRLLYMRWEYVDRSQVQYHGLWTKNPDGTGESVYFGNMIPGVLMIDAKPIPGTDDVVLSYSPGHGVNEHAGIASVISPKRGPDEPESVRALHKGPLTRDPIAVSADCFLAARDSSIVLMDGKGGLEVIYTHDGPGLLHEPRPVSPRPRERAHSRRTKPGTTNGAYILANAALGRNLPGVEQGEIRKLLVLESLPKPVNFSGGPDLISWLGTFTLERVLGTVPVEPDGSAYFEAPAGRQLFFVALDAQDRAIKRMQSFTSLMPGETQSCLGCHEHRTRTPGAIPEATLQALTRPASPISRFEGFPDVLDFHRDVQPVLDRNCVSCHNPETRREGHVSLAGDLGLAWSQSYFTLLAHRQVADGRNGLGDQPPRTLGAGASPLWDKLRGGHHDVKASESDLRTVWLWIESGAPYAGSYAALRNAEQQKRDGHAFGTAFWGQGDLLNKRCAQCHAFKDGEKGLRLPLQEGGDRWNEEARKKIGRPTAAHERIVFENDPLARYSAHVLVNFSRPALSAILQAPLAKSAGGWESCGKVFENRDDADYQALLAGIQKGIDTLKPDPRWATPGFRPNPQYLREMKRYGIVPESFDRDRDTLDPFGTDQDYWRSLWPRVPTTTASK